ncbi:MAG: hypothetical protein COB83_04025 [Gammaproteobacteria bacterium]|nr:MAG: hypothetical protein COB83_04025 [Gammaproteobacteria bacterium]
MKNNYTVLLIDDDWCSKDGINTPSEFKKLFLIDRYNKSNPSKPIELIFCTGQNDNGENDWTVVDNKLKKHEKDIDIILLDVVFKEHESDHNHQGLEYFDNICEEYPLLVDKVRFFTNENLESLDISDEQFFSKFNFYKNKCLSTLTYDYAADLFLDEEDLQMQLFQLLKIVMLPDGIWFASRQMNNLCIQVTKVAKSDASVLIKGETGVGKEVFAEMIHKNSNRSEAPFVTVNCAAIPTELFESELFGHKKGAFTGAIENRKGLFEEAEGGTLFLDEIGDISLKMQVKLLRVLQQKKFKRVGENKEVPTNIRVISATHQNLPCLISEGRFREDLYFRLSTFPLEVPSLRKRPEDIKLLVEKMLEDCLNRNNKFYVTLENEAKQLLLDYHYPGNVRELGNIIERLCILCEAKRSITTLDVEVALENSNINQTSYSTTENSSEKELTSINDLTLSELLTQINGYKAKEHEVRGRYEEIRSAFQHLILDSLVEINDRYGSKNKPIAKEFTGVAESNKNFLGRMQKLGLSNRQSKECIKNLEKNEKYKKLFEDHAIE